MVDVKKELPMTPIVPKTSGIPTFGSRRLASPDALKILENGKMRRQMQRAPQCENASDSPSVRIVNEENEREAIEMPSSSYSATTSAGAEQSITPEENKAFDTNVDDDDEPPTPSDISSHFPCQPHRRSKPSLRIPTSISSPEQGLFPSDAKRRASRPPQTSPFVAPLETIPSEAILTVDANDLNDETKDELIRTLSHLEGKGSPPKYDVDNAGA